MITKENVNEMRQKRLDALRSPDFVSKAEIWKAIRSHCLECSGSFVDVTSCDGDDWVGKCPLWSFRFGKRDAQNDGPVPKKRLRQAVREMCNQCMSGNVKCESDVCGLKMVRWGKQAGKLYG